MEEKILLNARVRYKYPQKHFNLLYKAQIENMVYPFGFMTGEWYEVDRISGEFFDFKGSNRPGIIPYTIKQFSDDEWEWDFKKTINTNNKTK